MPWPGRDEVLPGSGLLVVGPVLLPLCVSPRLLPPGPNPVPADVLLQARLGAGSSASRQIDCVKYVRETCTQEVPVHGLPDGSGAAGEDLHATRSATWCPEDREKHIPYTVCHMVPEQRVKTCTYRSATWCPSTA